MIEGVKTRSFLWYQGPAIIWAAALFVQSSIPANDIPELSFLEHDKIIHFLIYVIFAFVVHRAIRNQSLILSLARRHYLATFLLVSFYGASDEWHQAFVPGRDASLLDWLADTMGGTVYLAGHWVKEKVANNRQ